ncbi:MAG: biliverdin-producing heme oxygenase [Vicinamibacterales bacterium]
MTSQPSLARDLRDRTADDHRQAEHGPFQRRMAGARITRDEYRRWLEQMRLIHAAVEAAAPALAAVGSGNAMAAVGSGKAMAAGGSGTAMATVARAAEGKTARIRNDIAALGGTPEAAAPLPATRAFVERIARTASADPTALVGAIYVLEGSTNGNRFIAPRLADRLGLGPDGCAYLLPYGEDQPRHWAAFKVALDGIDASGAPREAIVRLARETFDAIRLMGEQLLEPAPAANGPEPMTGIGRDPASPTGQTRGT